MSEEQVAPGTYRGVQPSHEPAGHLGAEVDRDVLAEYDVIAVRLVRILVRQAAVLEPHQSRDISKELELMLLGREVPAQQIPFHIAQRAGPVYGAPRGREHAGVHVGG